MAWTAETAPPPYFGVAASGEPDVAHSFDWKNPGHSLCGVSLRLMQTEAETHLRGCQPCYDLAAKYEKAPRA